MGCLFFSVSVSCCFSVDATPTINRQWWLYVMLDNDWYSLPCENINVSFRVVTSSNTNKFSHCLQCQNQKQICNNTTTKDLTITQVCRYTI